jgi:hypothetical protein
VELNQILDNELNKMFVIAQYAVGVRSEKYKELPLKKMKKFKDRVYTTHEKRLQEIFNDNGFDGSDLAGKEGLRIFF